MGSARVVLCGLGAQVEGLRWEAGQRLRIGRQGDLEVVLNDPSVSRKHAEVAHTPRGWVLRDLGSRNGTFLNEGRVDEAGRPLGAGDAIRVGNVPLQATVVEGEKDAAPAGPCLKTTRSVVKLQAATRRSWERAVEQLTRPDDERLWPARRILPLLRAGHYLTQMTSLDELLRTLLGEVVTVLEAQRGAIVLADEATGALRLRAASAAHDRLNLAKCFSQTLAERCYQEGESLLCADVYAEAGLAAATSVAQGTMASVICALLRSPRRRLGVLHLDRGPFQEPFTADDFDLVDAVACYVSVGIESAKMLEQQRDLFLQAATALAQTVELRDEYTGSHTQRVTAYALLLAEELRLSPAERQHLEIAAPLHDIGKIAVADAVLRKPGRLTAEEFELMKAHVSKGAALLAHIPGLGPMLPIVRHHHERWDGSGYPDGLAGEAIARVARVVAVADAFDAMTSDRPYRPALPTAAAFAELEASAGRHFDPQCVAAFLRLRARVEAMLRPGPSPEREACPSRAPSGAE
jgi:HD-GYP domain-containing protein (c-di-GMP phosphodiesterase class II)/pSer/pThr/pTyr-binding forkhead associated (FHA) protein